MFIYLILFTFHVGSWFKFDIRYEKKTSVWIEINTIKTSFKFIYFWILCKYISQVVAYMFYLLLFIEEIRDVLVGY